MRIYNSHPKLLVLFNLIVLLAMSGMPPRLPSVQASTASSDGVRILQSGSQSIVLDLEIPAYTVRTIEVDGQTYQRISMDGYSLSSTPGEPELPQKGLLLGIPPGAQVDLTVLATESIVAPGFNVCPVPERYIEPLEPGRELLDQASDFQIRFVKNQSVYASNAFFPSAIAEIGDSGYLRDQRYVQILIHSVQYNPVTGELKYHQYIKLQVSFSYPQGRLSLAPGRAESPAFETVLQNSILNYEMAKPWRSGPQPKAQATSAPLDYLTEPSYKISVAQNGIYQLTYSDLEAAGLPVGIGGLDPRTFQLFNMGNEVAIYVKGEDDGSFGSDDYVLFYGQKMNTKYTDTNVYWLRYGESTGLRMSEKDGSLSGTATVPAYFETTIRANEDHIYGSIPSGSDHWYWSLISAYEVPTSQEFNTTLTNIATSPPTATVKIRLYGYTYDNSVDPDHHARIYLNDEGSPISDVTWDGQTEYQFEADVSQSFLIEGTNVFTVELPCDLGGVDSDRIYVDWFEIDYHRTYTAGNDSLFFSGDDAGTWEYHVDGFSTNDIEVFDITEPATTTKIVSTTVESTSSYTLKFEDTITDTTEYLALTAGQRLSPLSIMLDTFSDLHSTSNGDDYIMITHSDFYTDMVPLADHRAAQGPRVMIVDVQDIYDEFSYGVFDPEAIRDFLAYAYASWTAPAPSYVLLVGDGTIDFKDHMNTGTQNYIPPYLAEVDPEINETVTDNRYVAVSGPDILPDMHIGRLSVNTTAEAQTMVNKIIDYEQNPPEGDWNSRTLFVADNPDSAGEFGELSDDIVDNYLPPLYTADKIYLGSVDYPYEKPAVTARAAVIQSINEGKLLVNYIGHGAIPFWAGEQIFRLSDVASLANGGKLPMMLPMTCMEGYFGYPGWESLGESIVRASGGGAIASWSATGMGMALGHHYMNKGFFTAVFSDNIREIGTATYLGKLNLYESTTAYRDLMDTYVLFGDPFMKLNLPACDAADFDNDGRITVADIMQVAARWGSEWGDAGFDRKYDLDDDGDIDIVDVMHAAARWDEIC